MVLDYEDKHSYPLNPEHLKRGAPACIGSTDPLSNTHLAPYCRVRKRAKSMDCQLGKVPHVGAEIN